MRTNYMLLLSCSLKILLCMLSLTIVLCRKLMISSELVQTPIRLELQLAVAAPNAPFLHHTPTLSSSQPSISATIRPNSYQPVSCAEPAIPRDSTQ